jgi:hypothetical protein
MGEPGRATEPPPLPSNTTDQSATLVGSSHGASSYFNKFDVEEPVYHENARPASSKRLRFGPGQRRQGFHRAIRTLLEAFFPSIQVGEADSSAGGSRVDVCSHRHGFREG